MYLYDILGSMLYSYVFFLSINLVVLYEISDDVTELL